MRGMAGVVALLLMALGGAALKQNPPGWLPADASTAWPTKDSTPLAPPIAFPDDSMRKADHSDRIKGSIGRLHEVASQLHDLQVELVKQRQALDVAEAEKATAQAEFNQASREAANVTRTKARLMVKIDDIFKQLNMFHRAGSGDAKKILQLLYEKQNMQKNLHPPHYDDTALKAAEAENKQLKAALAQQRQATEQIQQTVERSQQQEAAVAEAQLSNVGLDELKKQHEEAAATHARLLAEQKRLDDAIKFAADPVGSVTEGLSGQPPVPTAAPASSTDPAAEGPECEKQLESVRAQIRGGMQTTSELNKALGDLVMAPP